MFKMLVSMPPLVALSIAIVCEVIATSSIPKTEQFTKLMPSTVVIIGYGIAFFLLSVTVKACQLVLYMRSGAGRGLYLWLLSVTSYTDKNSTLLHSLVLVSFLLAL